MRPEKIGESAVKEINASELGWTVPAPAQEIIYEDVHYDFCYPVFGDSRKTLFWFYEAAYAEPFYSELHVWNDIK